MHGGDIYRNKVNLDCSVNVNPLGMTAHVKQALQKAVGMSERYPDIRAQELKEALAKYVGVSPAHICVGNGASELFLAIVHALQPKRVLLQAPSFGGYREACKAADCDVQYVYCHAADQFALPDRVEELLTDEVDLIFLANPNNPVGNLMDKELLDRILKRAGEKQITVVLDECFLEFVEDGMSHSPMQALHRYPHVIVVRAFTKICAIPGVRLGYCVCGDVTLAECLRRHVPEWNISVFAQAAGVAAVKELIDGSYLEDTLRLIQAEREGLVAALEELGVHVFSSKANFLLLYSEKELYMPLLERGILIRECSDFEGLKKGYYRVAIQTPERNSRLVEAIKEVVCQM